MDLSPRISELLYHYDCVIVPELGGFVTEYRSARIDKLLHVIHPPSKDLRFNAQLKKNDGLLANAISRAEDISHEEANHLIKEAVEGYFSSLEEGRPVNFEKVGILYLDSQKNLQFSPDTSVNYLLESFRLKKVYAKPAEKEVVTLDDSPLLEEVEEQVQIAPSPEVVQIEPAEGVQDVEDAEKEIPVIPIEAGHNTARRWWVAAALIPLLLYVGWVGVRSDVIHDGTIQMSDLNPFKRSIQGQYEVRTDATGVDFSENMIPAEAVPVVKAPPAENIDRISTEESPVPVEKIDLEAEAVNTYVAPTAISTMEYHVIGGCFSEERNAQRLVDKLRIKGYEAFIIDTHRGLHRVAYGSYADRQEALKVLARVKEEESASAWLLRKK